jgi:hypothetical protein
MNGGKVAMKHAKDSLAIAFVAGVLVLMSCGVAAAAAMSCGSEYRACIQACGKAATQTGLNPCLSACNARQNYCSHTGCWNNGTSNYCGLQRK